jgi:hypothetical protein
VKEDDIIILPKSLGEVTWLIGQWVDEFAWVDDCVLFFGNYLKANAITLNNIFGQIPWVIEK